ncbi:MAG: hypothetical protein RJA22_2072 [Verrucomicrobiota bacterium]|jgi:tetratricopeptide (TPR) repeat protein
MPTRSTLTPAGAVLLVILAALAGCANPGRPGAGRAGSSAPAAGESSAARMDYSSDAIAARTESLAQYALGVLHDEGDEPREAADAYARAALADLGNTDLVLEASFRLLKLKRTDAAIDLLTKATAVPSPSALLLARLGLAHSIAGDRPKAIEANRRAIQRDPSLIAGYQFLAQLLLQENQAQEGLKVLAEAARQPKPDALFLVELGESYLRFARAGQAEAARPRALEAFRRAAALKPSSPPLVQRLADGFVDSGDAAQGARLYGQLLALAPEWPGLRQRLVEVLIRTGDHTNAIAHLRDILAESPTDVQSLYVLGSILFEERQLKEARDQFEKVLRLRPDFEPGYQDLAATLIGLNEPEDALETLRLARKRFPKRFVWEYYSALAHTRMKDYANALRFLTAAEIIARVSETNRLTPTLYFQLGSACERTQRFQEAEQHFRRALAIDPNFAEALNYLGYMWAERGENLAEARQMIEKAVRLEPRNPAFLDSLGWVLFKQNQPAAALPYLLQAIELNEEPDATLYDHLGDIYAALQKTEQAREAWRKAYELDPTEPVQRKLRDAPRSR